MTNPNNAIGTNGAFGGRTSVNAFNDDLAAFTRGVVAGWECVPDSGMTVKIGGSATVRDVAVAEDNSGNKTTINNISALPVSITIGGAPASNTRIDSIVAYVDNPPQGVSTVADNASACGIIVVAGTASSTPVAPNDTAIRTAITADGATGTVAYYAVLANITVANGTTTITAGEISAGDVSQLSGNGVVPSSGILFSSATDSEGWIKIALASNATIFMKQGSFSITMNGSSWTSQIVSSKPDDLDTSKTYRGIASGTSGDKAINVCGLVDFVNGKVEVEVQNAYTGSVTSDIYWQAYIIQIS